jgi:hypothetical protein
MPVYHFTLHAYRSWRPDHRRGYTEKGKGYQPPSEERARQYDENAKQEPVTFDSEIQKEILLLAHSICGDEGWRLEAVGFDPTHAHLVLAWRRFNRWEEVDRRLKNLLALKLNRAHQTPGKRWFVRGRSAPRRVKEQTHLDYLLETYLPDHPGLFWKREMKLPMLDDATSS